MWTGGIEGLNEAVIFVVFRLTVEHHLNNIAVTNMSAEFPVSTLFGDKNHLAGIAKSIVFFFQY